MSFWSKSKIKKNLCYYIFQQSLPPYFKFTLIANKNHKFSYLNLLITDQEFEGFLTVVDELIIVLIGSIWHIMNFLYGQLPAIDN